MTDRNDNPRMAVANRGEELDHAAEETDRRQFW
jgi:hypothetical protein